MKTKFNFLVILMLIVSLLMACITPMRVNATEQKGSLTIFKKDSTTEHNPIGNVGFSIYKVADDFTNTAVNVATLTQTGSEQKTDTTGANKGKTTFSNLEVGRYLVVESSKPDEITDAITPFLVDIPQYTVSGGTVTANYDVLVEPKNTIGFGSFKIVTHDLTVGTDDATNIKAGVNYTLQYKDGSQWKDISELSNPNTTPTVPTLKSDATGTIEVSNLPVGDYRFVMTSVDGDNDYIIDTTPYTISVKNIGGTITATEDGVTADDTLDAYINKPTDDKTTTYADASAGYNDTIDYTVTVGVPTATVARLATFEVVDNYGEGLTVDANTLVVKSGATTLTKDTHYTVTNTSNVLKVTFTTAGKTALAANNTATLEYTAKVSSVNAYFEAGSAKNQLNNASKVVYTNVVYPTGTDDRTNNPSNPTTNDTDGNGVKDDDTSNKSETDEDIVVLKTYHQAVLKTNASSDALAGAKFQLSTSAATDTNGKPLAANLVTAWDGTQFTTTFTSGADGKLTIQGLKAGTYYLFEVEAPQYTEGTDTKAYQRLTAPKTITVNETSDAATDASPLTVVNHKPIDLPATGAASAVGLVVLGSAVVVYGMKVYNKNKEN